MVSRGLRDLTHHSQDLQIWRRVFNKQLLQLKSDRWQLCLIEYIKYAAGAQEPTSGDGHREAAAADVQIGLEPNLAKFVTNSKYK
jgi:hypothetical protein